MSKESIFERFTEKEGEETTTLSCRVTKETRKIFEAHAKSKYGSVTTGLKRILFDYMSQYPFRRQIVNIPVNIFIPLLEMKDNEMRMLPTDTRYYEIVPLYFEYASEYSIDFNSINCIVSDYREFTPSTEFEEDTYYDFDGWLYKKFGYNLGDGLVVSGFLNNYLDKYIDGVYKDNEFMDNSHEGLFIFEFEEEYYYICFRFTLEDKYDDDVYAHLVSNEEAYKMAIECDNIELAKFIDSLNEGTSNIDGNIKLLEDKKKSLQHQIEEIDDKLSKLK